MHHPYFLTIFPIEMLLVIIKKHDHYILLLYQVFFYLPITERKLSDYLFYKDKVFICL
jgi:hypothetical protein